MSTTEDRIESLENQRRDQQSQVRRQRRWNIALGAVVVVGGLMAATGVRSVPDVIQAKKFEVVNDEGKVIVRLGKSRSGNGLVETQNGKGQALVVIGATVNGEGVVETENGKGGTLVELGANANGGIFTTQNGKGVLLVRITTDRSGNGAVLAQDASGNIKATLP